MSKAKSVVITVLLAIAVAVATLFSVISFPGQNKVKTLTSVASNIHLGADFSGYAETTVYPEGVLTAVEYGLMSEEEDFDSSDYTKVGAFYVENEKHADIEALKKSVKADAETLNKRFGEKGYSDYSVATEDGLSVKISVPTNFTYNSYKHPEWSVADSEKSRSVDLNAASSAISTLSAFGELTLRTTDTSISLTDSNGNSSNYDTTRRGKDKWVEEATVTSSDSGTSSASNTYSLTDGEDAASYFKSITCRRVGNNSVITFNFTKEGRQKFNRVTTLAASSSSQTIYFFVGNRQLISFSCETPVDQKSLSLTASDFLTAQNSAITMNSVVHGGALSLDYRDIENVVTSTAGWGENAGILVLVASILVLAAMVALMSVKYKWLGAITSFIGFILALVELYALCLLNIQFTFGVLIAVFVCVALFTVSNVVLFAEVKRLTESGRTIQASIKEAYKKVIMTVSDMHIVLLVLAILLAAVGVGEVAACGLISVVGVVASYVLYWFNRFMWYVTSSTAKDKFKFAGLKRVVYEDD